MTMARLASVDTLVQRVLGAGDVEISAGTAADRLAILREAQRQAQSDAVRSYDEERDARQARFDRLDKARQARVEAREARDPRGTALRKGMVPWVEAGLAERITTFHASRPAKLGINLFLAALDWFVFARAAAIALDIEVDATNVEYWLGGSFGLLVFFVGLFTARAWKQVRLAYAQRNLGTPDGAVASIPPFGEAFASTALLVLLCFASALVRVEAPGGESQSVVLFQMLVPVVMVLSEYFLHDPIHYDAPRRTPVDWWLDRQHRAAEARLASLPSLVNYAAVVDAHFAMAEAKLRVELSDRGFR